MSRQTVIVDLLAEQGFQSVAALAQHCGVDVSTIRRDLDKLTAEGLIRRTHGGATLAHPVETSPRAWSGKHRVEKEAIGAAMAERVLEGQTILLDSGATTVEVAKRLPPMRLTVVTHDLRVGLEIARKPTMNLVFIGGELLPTRFSMWGPSSIQQLETMRVNVAVFGTDTVMDDGLYATSSYEIELKRAMRGIANEAFFVADSSKFGREALFKVFGFDEFTAGITDSTLDPIRAARFPIPLIRAAVPSSAALTAKATDGARPAQDEGPGVQGRTLVPALQ